MHGTIADVMKRLPAQSQEPASAGTRPAIRFDRNELSGAFGDMGTDVPLIIGVALASHLDGASVLIMFGAMQILT
ncbi:MAG TPA: molybdate transporter family protein, partial [Burkholderiales bacterium]